MTEQNLDELLKDVYQAEGTVPPEWNQRLLAKHNEKTGGTHDASVTQWKTPVWRRGVAAAVLIFCMAAIPASVYAYFHYLTPAQTAKEMGMDKLAEKFGQKGEQAQSVSVKGYRISYLGQVTGKNLEQGLKGAEVEKEKTYIVTAVQKESGEAMTYGDRFFVGPLVRGLDPVHFNIAGRGSSAVRMIDNGIQYCISECDTIGIFADRDIYLAVQEGDSLNAEAYAMDRETGVISANKDYEKVNVLFPLRLDPGMADEEKAAAYIAEVEKELTGPEESADEKVVTSIQEDGSELTFPSDCVETAGDAAITLRISGEAKRANNMNFDAFYLGENGTLDINFLPVIQGEGIRKVTFEADGGKFYKLDSLPREKAEQLRERAWKEQKSFEEVTKYKKIYSADVAENALYYGMSGQGSEVVSVTPDGEKTAAQYALRVERKLTDEPVKELQKKLVEELEKLKIGMKIEMEDGTVVRKEITCHVTKFYFDGKTKDKDSKWNRYYYEYQIH